MIDNQLTITADRPSPNDMASGRPASIAVIAFSLLGCTSSQKPFINLCEISNNSSHQEPSFRCNQLANHPFLLNRSKRDYSPLLSGLEYRLKKSIMGIFLNLSG